MREGEGRAFTTFSFLPLYRQIWSSRRDDPPPPHDPPTKSYTTTDPRTQPKKEKCRHYTHFRFPAQIPRERTWEENIKGHLYTQRRRKGRDMLMRPTSSSPFLAISSATVDFPASQNRGGERLRVPRKLKELEGNFGGRRGLMWGERGNALFWLQ